MSVTVSWQEKDATQYEKRPVRILLGYNWIPGANQMEVAKEVERISFLDHDTLAIEYKNEQLEIPDDKRCDVTLAVWDESGNLSEVWGLPDAMLYGGGKNWLLQTKWWETIYQRTKYLKGN